MKKIGHLMMETEKCYKLKGLRSGDVSAASPMPSPRTGDDAVPAQQSGRERENTPSSSSHPVFCLQASKGLDEAHPRWEDYLLHSVYGFRCQPLLETPSQKH